MNTPNAWPQGEETFSSTLIIEPTFIGIVGVGILAGVGLMLYIRKRKKNP